MPSIVQSWGWREVPAGTSDFSLGTIVTGNTSEPYDTPPVSRFKHLRIYEAVPNVNADALSVICDAIRSDQTQDPRVQQAIAGRMLLELKEPGDPAHWLWRPSAIPIRKFSSQSARVIASNVIALALWDVDFSLGPPPFERLLQSERWAQTFKISVDNMEQFPRIIWPHLIFEHVEHVDVEDIDYGVDPSQR